MQLTTALKGEDLFGSLGREHEERSTRKFEVSKGPTLEFLAKGFEELLVFSNPGNLNEYAFAEEWVKGRDLTRKDIEHFSLLLAPYQENRVFHPRSGMYLSALINSSKDEEFSFNFRYLTTSVGWLGQRNKSKRIMVDGNVGDNVGDSMLGGYIAVKGNTGIYSGFRMKGGELHIHGHAAKDVGLGMTGGKIFLYGTFWNIPENNGGEIYYKDNLWMKDGRKVR